MKKTHWLAALAALFVGFGLGGCAMDDEEVFPEEREEERIEEEEFEEDETVFERNSR